MREAIGLGADGGGRALAATPAMRRLGWAVGLAVMGACVGAFAGWSSQKPVYRAEALIHVAPNLPSPQDPDGANALPMYFAFVAYQVQLLQTDRAAQLALESPAWQASGEAKTPEAVARFKAHRRIVHAPQTEHLQVQFDDAEPAVALAGVRAQLAALETLSSEESAGDARLADAQSQVEELAAQLGKASERAEHLAAPFGGVAGLEVRHRAYVTRLLNAEADLLRITEEIRDARDAGAAARSIQLDELLARQATLSENLADLRKANRELEQARAEAAKLEAERDDLRRRRDQARERKDVLAEQRIGKGRLLVADPGALPTAPLEDGRRTFAGLGAGLGGLLGALAGASLRRRRRKTP